MKKEKLYALLGELNEETVHAAEKTPEARSGGKWLRYAAAAACVCLLTGAGIWLMSGREKPREDSSAAETAVLSQDVSIFYVDGESIVSKTEYLPCTPEAVFTCWKDANGIGGEVRLLRSKIESIGAEEYSEDSAAGYRTGDSFKYCLTVTKNLEDYCSGAHGSLLLESLKMTMTSHSEISYDDFELTLE